ncbi:MAG: hypothetical protein K0S33_793 [Bacteroidetes bacterium]|nr:hypothetical protein [Bacteroidota bacterium]
MENKKNNCLLLILSLPLLLLNSCGPASFSDVMAYKAHVKANDELVQQKEFNKIAYTVNYVPNAIIALRDLDAGKAVSRDSFNHYLDKTRDRIYFSFTISDVEGSYKIREEIDSKKEYSYDLSYFNQVLEKNVQLLIDDEDSLQTAFVHLEPVSSLKPMFRCFVSFDLAQHPKINKGFTFVVNDHLFGNGNIKFYYDQASINDLPTLKL